MNKKFKNLTTDSDTKIIFRKDMAVNGLDAIHEQWNWDGIVAESLIFTSKEVASISDDMFTFILSANSLLESRSQITIKRLEEFTFVNFNFNT